MTRIAALFVEGPPNGVYCGLPGVDPWPESRDARLYSGPYPVVCHSPCARWGRYWNGGPSAREPRRLGDDGGCFAAALRAVRRWGGVLEHPEASHAWRKFGLMAPPRDGGWIRARLDDQGWTCCVEQGHYGHKARKVTWLYAVDVELTSLIWGRSEGKLRLDDGFHSKEERRRIQRLGQLRHPRMPRRECAATPPEFRDLLLAMARSVYRVQLRNTNS